MARSSTAQSLAHAWVFDQPNPREKARDPQQAELLRRDDFEPAESLVREALQNSLDAHRPGAPPVHVRIFVSGDRAALSPVDAPAWFRGLQPHVRACERGGQVASDAFAKPCRFVTIEDFSTIGLTGDYEAHDPERGGNYYNFIWAEGISSKDTMKGGRWGVGKYVFPNASTINTFFALTVREGENQPLLIGQSVLQQHVVDGVTYQPDGWWSDETQPGQGAQRGLQVPVSDPAIIDRFCSAWSVSRARDAPGLTVVVPYASRELDRAGFTRAVARAYYLAILEGRLTVQIVDGDTGTGTHLESGTLRSIMTSVLPRTDAAIPLAQIVATREEIPEANRLELPPLAPSGSVQDLGIPDDALVRLRDAIEAGEVVQITLHQQVKHKHGAHPGGAIDAGTCHVFLQRDRSGDKNRPHFFRSGILVSEASTLRLPGIRALAIVGDDPLGTMLGDAESPAHTQWSPNDRVTSRYAYAKTTINNVRLAPKRLYDMIVNAHASEERIVFSDIFNIPEDASRARGRRFKRGGIHARRSSPADSSAQRPSGPLLRVSPAQPEGFTVAATGAATPDELQAVTVRMAYDTATGCDPFAHWTRFDFVTRDLQVTITGGTVLSAGENVIDADVDDPGTFSLHVRGFDARRDLVVDAHPMRPPAALTSASAGAGRRAAHGRHDV